MADAFSDSSALADQIVTAYERNAFFALREGEVFNQFATVKPGNLTSPGNPVSFLFYGDLAISTTALGETTDPDAVALSDSLVTVTPAEYGNSVLVTIVARTDSFALGFDPNVANVISWNLVDSLDNIVRIALDAGGTEVIHAGATAATDIIATDIISADAVRTEHARLRAASVMPISMGAGTYVAVADPLITFDLKGETGDGAWVAPHQYVDTRAMYSNELGTFGGFQFIESPRVLISADGGSGTVDVYTTYYFGREALAAAVSIAPSIIPGPVIDKFKRFMPLGWYFYAGWGVFRSAALRRYLCASSLGAN